MHSTIIWRSFFCTILMTSLTISAGFLDSSIPDEQQILVENALRATYHTDSSFLTQMRTILDSIGYHLHQIWHRVRGSTPETPHNQSPNTQAPTTTPLSETEHKEVDASLKAIRDSFEQLRTESAAALHNPNLNNQEKEAALALKQQSTNALLIDTLAGGGGASLMYYIQSLDPIGAIRSAPREKTRFIPTGLEIPAVGAIIGPLLKPAAYLVGGLFVYYKAKGHFVDPYKRKHKELLDKFSQENTTHRTHMERLLKQHEDRIQQQFLEERKRQQKKFLEHTEQQQKEITAMSGEIEQIRKHFVEIELHFDQDITKLKQQLTHALEDHIRGMTSKLETLEKENDNATKELRSVLAQSKIDLETIRKTIAEGQHATQELTRYMKDTAKPTLERIKTVVDGLRKRSEDDLALLRNLRTPSPVPTLAPAPAPTSTPTTPLSNPRSIGGGGVLSFRSLVSPKSPPITPLPLAGTSLLSPTTHT